MLTPYEQSRQADFDRNPGLESYIAIALEDLQSGEDEEAAEEGREARDTGTTYSLRDGTYEEMKQDYLAWVIRAGADGETFADALGWDQFGSDFHMTRVGHGVGYWDRGMGEVGDRLTDDVERYEGLYFGDDGEVYVA